MRCCRFTEREIVCRNLNKDIKNTLEEIKGELGDWDALEIGTSVDQDMIETYGQGGPVGESRDVSYKILPASCVADIFLNPFTLDSEKNFSQSVFSFS